MLYIYTIYIYTKIPPYIFLMLGLRFLQDTGFEKPNYMSGFAKFMVLITFI